MINVDPENASSAADIPDASGIFGNIDDIAASVGEKKILIRDLIWKLRSCSCNRAGNQNSKRRCNLRMHRLQKLHLLEEENDLDLAEDSFVPEGADAQISRISWQISRTAGSRYERTHNLTVFPDVVF